MSSNIQYSQSLLWVYLNYLQLYNSQLYSLQSQMQKDTTETFKSISPLGTSANTSAFSINTKNKTHEEKRSSIPENWSSKQVGRPESSTKISKDANETKKNPVIERPSTNDKSSAEEKPVKNNINLSNKAGGVMKSFADDKNKDRMSKENLRDKIYNFLDIQGIIKSLAEMNPIQQKELQKIIRNFVLIIELDPKKSERKENKDVILESQDINEISTLPTEEQKNLMKAFWSNIIHQLIQNSRFLSLNGCLQAIKLHISWNKETYLNLGKMKTSIFPQQLFKVINTKIIVERSHNFFKKVVIEIQSLILNYFKGMKIIFEEVQRIKLEKNKQEMQCLKFLTVELERNMLENLLSSFKSSVLFVQQISDTYQYVYQDIFHCLVSAFQFSINQFKEEHVLKLLQIFEQSYVFFNQIPSESLFKNDIEKFVVKSLMIRPFTPEKWSLNIKKSIRGARINFLIPFQLILDQNIENKELYRPQIINAQNWIDLINYILQKEYYERSPLKEEFIFNAICKIAYLRSNQFWEDLPEFEQIKYYINQLGNAIDYEGSSSRRYPKKESYQLIRMMICLMGRRIDQGNVITQYPLSKGHENAYKVCKYFAKSILQISNETLFAFLSHQYEIFLADNFDEQDQDFDFFSLHKSLVFQFFLKVCISEPSYFIELFEGSRKVYFIEIIINKITSNKSNEDFIQLMFTCLDSLISNSDTKNIIAQILNDLFNKEDASSRIQYICSNKMNFEFISRHAINLIESDCCQLQWSRQIFYCLFALSKKLYTASLGFYADFITHIFISLINNKINLTKYKASILRDSINFDFILEYVRHILCFRYYPIEKVHLNNLLATHKFKQLFLGIKFINSLLLLNLHESSPQMTDFEFLSQTVKRNLLTNNKDGNFQLISSDNQLTSYLVGYIIIILNMNSDIEKQIYQICPSFYENLYEGAFLLVKTYPEDNAQSLFSVYNSYSLSSGSLQTKQQFFLSRFKEHVERVQSAQALQILLLGNLCSFEFAISVADKIKIKLQSRALFKSVSISRKAKILSSLSRYLYFAIFNMYIKSNKSNSKIEKEMKEHLELFLQALVRQSQSCFDKTPQIQKHIQSILSNIYNSFLLVQCFNRSLFLKWIINYHRLILHHVNLKLRCYQKEESYQVTGFSDQYFKICQMLLCCSQYLSDKEYDSIIKIETLPHSLQSFIFHILEVSDFDFMSPHLIQITLELLINGIKMYYETKKSEKVVLNQFWRLISQNKRYFLCQTNYIILDLLLSIYLQKPGNPQQVNYEDVYWPLKVNNLFSNKHVIEKVLEMFQSSHHKIFFVSGCNLISTSILNNTFEWRTNNYLNKIISLLQRSLRKDIENYDSYQTIWYVQFLQLICLKQEKHQKELIRVITKFIFNDECFLRRFGYLIKKIGVVETGKEMKWGCFKQNTFNYYDAPKSISFAQKLQLNQLFKLTNFVMVNIYPRLIQKRQNHQQKTTYQNSEDQGMYINQYKAFSNSIVSCEKIFESLLNSQSKVQAFTEQQKKAQQRYIQSDKMMQSGIIRHQKENLQSAFIKITSYLELQHCIINVQIVSQFIVAIISIINRYENQVFKNTKFSQRHWSNQICLKFIQKFSKQFAALRKNQSYIEPILENFTNKYYTKQLKLAEEMYFTNSKNLTSFLSTSYQQFSSLIKSDLQLLFQTMYTNRKSMKANVCKEYQSDTKSFNSLLLHLKRELPTNSQFDFNRYLGLDDIKSRNTILKNTVNNRTIRTQNKSQKQSKRMENM